MYDLGVAAGAGGGNKLFVKMTLTAPGCGMGPVIAEDARGRIAGLPGVEAAQVEIVWDPPWNPHMISPAGREKLGLG
jgi:metal-sulfur cluster biosynthetic enzyme